MILLMLLMPLAAFLYSSVGHGGASSYIVLLTLFGFAPAEVRPAALLLNIAVSAISFLTFRKTCSFPKELFLSLILFSIPASFIGGTFLLDEKIYRKILGLLLLLPISRLFNIFKLKESKPVERKFWMAPAWGLAIGFVSGLVGIGGGILLSPVLILLGWANLKQTAAISSLFIFLNSISGLIGSGLSGLVWPSHFEILLPLTVAGGIAGGYYGANRYSAPAMKYALATVLTVASVKFLL
ncbi:MAG: sulfite exporter TauE/SafE family protein [Bacteroidetes bacterium]|nr:sulfite exporter TauE/SafE family protein [Bacteroidota bacterium]MBS1541258.1 sulfite exporter TauE/SafE family protein [Bacteroidota bacterium]